MTAEIWKYVDENGNIKELQTDGEKRASGFISLYRLSWVETAFPIFSYTKLTNCPDRYQHLDKREYTKAEAVIQKYTEPAGKLISCLSALYQVEAYKHLLAEYEAGKIRPGLAELLEVYAGDTESIAATMEGRFDEYVLQAAKEGQLDFTDFNLQHETDKDWFKKYRLTTHAIPGIYGAISNLGRLTVGEKTTLETFREGIRQDIKAGVSEMLAAGSSPEEILLIANEIKERYTKNKKAGHENVLNQLFRYRSEHEAGFIIDVKQAKIYDLRPYAYDLPGLLEPGFEALKEFYQQLKTEIRNIKNRTDTPAKIYGGFTNLQTEIPFVPIKNTPETLAINSVTGKIDALYIQTELPGLEIDDNPLYNYEKELTTKSRKVIIKISGARKGEVLDPGIQKAILLNDWLLAKTGNRCFAFDVDEFMEKCGKDTSNASVKRDFRKRLWSQLEFLRTKFSFMIQKDGNTQIHSIVSGYGKSKGGKTVYIALTPEYCAYKQNNHNTGLLWVSDYIFRSDERNPHLIPFILALTRNRQIKHNVMKGSGRANIISFRALIENDDELLYKLKRKGLNYRRYVIEPALNTIATLIKDKVIQATYIDRSGRKHTPDEIKFVTIGDFLDGDKWRLKYEFVGYKDDPELLERFNQWQEEKEEKKLKEAYKKGYKAGKKKAEKKSQ